MKPKLELPAAPTPSHGPAGATRKRALPAAAPPETNEEQLNTRQARALAALRVNMTPALKSSPPPEQTDAPDDPAPPHLLSNARPAALFGPDAAAPAAASLHLLTAAAAAESRGLTSAAANGWPASARTRVQPATDASMDEPVEGRGARRSSEAASVVTPAARALHRPKHPDCNPMQRRLQPDVPRLQPDAAQAATRCTQAARGAVFRLLPVCDPVTPPAPSHSSWTQSPLLHPVTPPAPRSLCRRSSLSSSQ